MRSVEMAVRSSNRSRKSNGGGGMPKSPIAHETAIVVSVKVIVIIAAAYFV